MWLICDPAGQRFGLRQSSGAFNYPAPSHRNQMFLETNSIGQSDVIQIHGAREHNLKNLSLAIPRGRFVVVTGVSGSGKSTLAFDLLFAEGQRRFLDSMTAYAHQLVEQLSRPAVVFITVFPRNINIQLWSH